MVETAGSRKVVFGSDLPWYSQHYHAGQSSCPYFRRARHDILHRNAERLLGEHLEGEWSERSGELSEGGIVVCHTIMLGLVVFDGLGQQPGGLSAISRRSRSAPPEGKQRDRAPWKGASIVGSPRR